MRRAFPYTPFDNRIQENRGLPMDVPDLAFRNHYSTPSETRRGEAGNTLGDKAHIIPVQTPHDTSAGGPFKMPPYQGSDGELDQSISSNVVTGGVVKGYITNKDSIRKAILVSRNLFSPTAHPCDSARVAASAVIPPRAIKPSKDIGMPEKQGKRGTGGKFTIPAPLATPQWPTSTEWLRSRFH